MIEKLYPLLILQKRYLDTGLTFGEAVSYIYLGECIGFKRILRNLEDLEREYAKRGFRTISIDDFEDCGGHGKSLEKLVGLKREPEEEPIYHAKLYKENFLGIQSDIINRVMKGETVIGIYERPSTEAIANKRK
jgi:hypothetical protein